MTKTVLPAVVGNYFVVYPGIVSVFWDQFGRAQHFVRRYWSFLVTERTATEIRGINTTTGHLITIPLTEIVGWFGNDSLPPHYLRPLRLKLNSQVCWDAANLWRDSISELSFVAA
jgi:hypothetical protein